MDLLKYPKMMKNSHCESSSNKKHYKELKEHKHGPKKTQSFSLPEK